MLGLHSWVAVECTLHTVYYCKETLYRLYCLGISVPEAFYRWCLLSIGIATGFTYLIFLEWFASS